MMTWPAPWRTSGHVGRNWTTCHVAPSVSALLLLNPCRGISSTATATTFNWYEPEYEDTEGTLEEEPVKVSRARKTFSWLCLPQSRPRGIPVREIISATRMSRRWVYTG